VADVILVHPTTGARSEPLRGKLDSGADILVIPEILVDALCLSPHARAWARSYDGTYAQRQVYYTRLSIEGFDIPGVRCIATDRRDLLVGRNVLNRFVITLDGRQLRFHLRPA
jgi:predicted aspartyl protease